MTAGRGQPGAAAGPPSSSSAAAAAAAETPTARDALQRQQGWWARFKGAVKRLKREVLALHYAIQDPRVGVLPRAVALLALAYALSPLDLIPDFIPVLGLVDDLLILPALLLLARRLIPADVLAEARQRAEREPLRLHKNWGMACLFFLMWNALLLGAAWWACARFGSAAVHQYQVWIVAGSGLVLVAAEAAWVVVQRRREAQQAAALRLAGAAPELEEALLSGGSAAVQQYLEP